MSRQGYVVRSFVDIGGSEVPATLVSWYPNNNNNNNNNNRHYTRTHTHTHTHKQNVRFS